MKKNYKVETCVTFEGVPYITRRRHFLRLADAMEYAATRGDFGETWTVTNLLTGETYSSK